MTIETKSGIKTIDLTVENGKAAYAKVNMGKAILDPKKIPVKAEGDTFISQEIMVGDKPYTVTCVSMGNPHCVVFTEGIDTLDLKKQDLNLNIILFFLTASIRSLSK